MYHMLLPNLQGLTDYLAIHICSSTLKDLQCHKAASSLLSASYLDVDYTSPTSSSSSRNSSPEVSIIAYFPPPTVSGGKWNEMIDYHEHERCEVGLLSEEKRLDDAEVGELRMGGWLTVVGGDRKPKATLFSFPSRHHSYQTPYRPLSSPSSSTQDPPSSQAPTFHATFQHPTGLHPTLSLSLPATILQPPESADDRVCVLHTHLLLPSTLFIDRHAFIDTLFLRSHNLKTVESVVGATDLEAPEWNVEEWGSSVLFSIDTTSVRSSAKSRASEGDGKGGATGAEGVEVTVPLHLRYLSPAVGGYDTISLPYPTLFWACNSNTNSSGGAAVDFKPAGNPFDRTHLGYEGSFDEGTMFYHVNPATSPRASVGDGRLTLEVKVPVLDLKQAWYVEPITAAVVGMGILWVLWKCFGPVGKSVGAASKGGNGREGSGGRKGDERNEKREVVEVAVEERKVR